MNNLVIKNFEMTRGFFLREVEGILQEVASIQPEGFNNNIHWHIGHVLTVTEQFMFGFPRKTTNLPPNYVELFGNGTKPADWPENVPTVEELIVLLKDQIGRLKEIPAESLNESLQKPFLGLDTFGQLANMALFHEANHLGKIQTMKRIVQAKL